jgi:hypothetical protein
MSSKIVGPFWEAKVEVVRLADPIDNPGLRALFEAHTAAGRKPRRRPTTLLMLADVRKVRVREARKNGGSYTWTNGPSPKRVSDEDLEALLRSGELVLLLVESDDRDQYTCLAGEINLDQLQPRGDTRQRLFQDLHLEEAQPGQRTGAAGLSGSVSAHGSGLSIYGLVTLPWHDERVVAPFQLTERLPGPGARLTIEVERLTDEERSAWIEVWAKLSVRRDGQNCISRPARSTCCSAISSRMASSTRPPLWPGSFPRTSR